MTRVSDTELFSVYHYEAAIASEHLKAKSYSETNWKQILEWYNKIEAIKPSAMNKLNQAYVMLELNIYSDALLALENIDPLDLKQREHLYHGTLAELNFKAGKVDEAILSLDDATSSVSNHQEKKYLDRKKQKFIALKSKKIS